jgi:hypothetical protein
VLRKRNGYNCRRFFVTASVDKSGDLLRATILPVKIRFRCPHPTRNIFKVSMVHRPSLGGLSLQSRFEKAGQGSLHFAARIYRPTAQAARKPAFFFVNKWAGRFLICFFPMD